MLSEIEVTYFRSRIDDVLREGQVTAWQRQFLQDMRGKIGRYGTRTRLSEKQLSALRRLTKIAGDANLQSPEANQSNTRPQMRPQRSLQRPSWQWPRRRWRYREIKLVVLLAMMAIVAVLALLQQGLSFVGDNPAPSGVIASQPLSQGFTITDGDTIRMSDGTPVRLVGFNTPETFEPRCEREAQLGKMATDRLRQLVASGTATVTKTACACKPGTEGTKQCNFGRSCGILRVDGRDVGQTLISDGLAAPFICGPTSCPRLPRPWCS
ncbi:MAG: thermonuclease family protein [Pseudorhizobium sp.]